ncbi:MAG: hypothetical protein Q8Q42_01855 [Nanoarchaeota archaeon]|nr:hypothetical protein [Nanoarchaeota archaeon]
MKQVIIELKSLETVNFEPKGSLAKMSFSYAIDGRSFTKMLNFDLNKKPEVIINGLLNFVKSEASLDTDEDDLLGSMYVKKVVDEEKIEERLFMFFSKIVEKNKFMKINRTHSDYMKLYQEINGSKIFLNKNDIFRR